jgi:hypothetical protein
MCKRNRPKYKVGDILEDYVQTKDDKGDIVHWLVAEVKFVLNRFEIYPRRKKHTNRKSVIRKKRMQNPRYESCWEYHLKLLTKGSTLEDWTVDCKSIDKYGYFMIKKVG